MNGSAENFDHILNLLKGIDTLKKNLCRESLVFMFFPRFDRIIKSNSNLNYKRVTTWSQFVGKTYSKVLC